MNDLWYLMIIYDTTSIQLLAQLMDNWWFTHPFETFNFEGVATSGPGLRFHPARPREDGDMERMQPLVPSARFYLGFIAIHISDYLGVFCVFFGLAPLQCQLAPCVALAQWRNVVISSRSTELSCQNLSGCMLCIMRLLCRRPHQHVSCLNE